MDLIAGLPLHVLIIHAVVIFVPLSVIGALLVIFIPKLRPAYTPLVVGAILVSVVSSFIATQSGEALSERVGLPLAHATWGERLFRLVVVFAILFTIWFAVEKKIQLSAKSKAQYIIALKVLISIAAVGCIALTVVTGHLGAEASWKYRINSNTNSAN